MRADRDAFRVLLKKHREQGVLKARTHWRRYREVIRKEPEYLCMETNLAGSRPRELFADVVADLDDRFNQDAVKIKAALRAAGFAVACDTDWTDFLAALDPPEMQERLKCASSRPACMHAHPRRLECASSHPGGARGTLGSVILSRNARAGVAGVRCEVGVGRAYVVHRAWCIVTLCRLSHLSPALLVFVLVLAPVCLAPAGRGVTDVGMHAAALQGCAASMRLHCTHAAALQGCAASRRLRCRGVSDVNVRLCFEELWARENQKRTSSDTQRRALKYELARKMKKAADFVRPDMEWPAAQRLMLEHGFSILNDMDPRDCEQVRAVATRAPPCMHAQVG